MDTNAIELTDADYREKLAGQNGIVLFYKKICPHCKALKKVIEKFTAVVPSAAIMQIDSEENLQAMADIDVSRAPTLLIIKNGEVAAKKPGLMNVRELTALYQSV